VGRITLRPTVSSVHNAGWTPETSWIWWRDKFQCRKSNTGLLLYSQSLKWLCSYNSKFLCGIVSFFFRIQYIQTSRYLSRSKDPQPMPSELGFWLIKYGSYLNTAYWRHTQMIQNYTLKLLLSLLPPPPAITKLICCNSSLCVCSFVLRFSYKNYVLRVVCTNLSVNNGKSTSHICIWKCYGWKRNELKQRWKGSYSSEKKFLRFSIRHRFWTVFIAHTNLLLRNLTKSKEKK